jgi:hypothetical protein
MRLPEDTNLMKLEACRAYARMMNSLSTSHIEPWLADDLKYTSQWVAEDIVGKENYLAYIGGKIQSIKRAGSRVWAEIAYTDALNAVPCVVLAQSTPDDLKATLLIEMNGSKIGSMCMCCVPAPQDCRRTGEVPT